MSLLNTPQAVRYPVIDLLRSLAILSMMAYHFSFDLNQFGVIQQAFNDSLFWLGARAFIVTSFLTLVGISLVLAHDKSSHHYWQRITKLAICAIIVSLGSFMMFPDSYIFFGILHFILVSSLICRLLLNFYWLNLVVGILVILLGVFYSHSWFDQPLMQWVGLMTFKPITEDYVPIFPWLGVVLIGLFLGQHLIHSTHLQLLASRKLTGLSAALACMGKRSLLIYMLHQPILMGLLWIFLH
jgi:uncharacterized membrane protein